MEVCRGASRRAGVRRRPPRRRHRRPAPPARRFRRRAHLTRDLAALVAVTLVKIAFVIQRYGTEVLGGSEQLCRLHRRAARGAARRRSADHLRARLHHMEERVSRRVRPHPRRHRPAVRQRADARHRRVQHATPSGSINNPHTPRDEIEWLKQQGPWCSGAHRVPATPPAAVRRPDVLHVSLRADRARPRDRAGRSMLVPTAHDEPAIQLGIFKEVFSRPAAICYLTDSERRVRPAAVSESAAARGGGRRRRRSAAAAAVPADAGDAGRR